MAERNDLLTQSLNTEYVRNYSPTTALGNALSMFSLLPGLRGFWSMSGMDNAGNVEDYAGNLLYLLYAGNPVYRLRGIVPCIDCDGAGDWLYRNDTGNARIDGTEAWMAADLRGMTVGGWFTLDTGNAGGRAFMSKYSGAPANSWLLYSDSAAFPANVKFYVSGDGTVLVGPATADTPVAQSTWFWAVGRFVPSTSVDLWINQTKYSQAVGVPASIFGCAAPLNVMGINSATGTDGEAALCFMTASALPDRLILALYHHTRALFNK